VDEAMKKKRIAIKAPPRIRELAERLFDIGMNGWYLVDKKKTPMKFSEIESPGQIAAWYAIAMYVDSVMKEPF
jgi:hypothetical protein